MQKTKEARRFIVALLIEHKWRTQLAAAADLNIHNTGISQYLGTEKDPETLIEKVEDFIFEGNRGFVRKIADLLVSQKEEIEALRGREARLAEAIAALSRPAEYPLKKLAHAA